MDPKSSSCTGKQNNGYSRRQSRGAALSRAGDQQPTWEDGQLAGEGADLALGPIPLLQLALQGMELAVAAVDEVLGSPFRLHLDDENLGRTEVGGRAWEARGRERGRFGGPRGFSASVRHLGPDKSLL